MKSGLWTALIDKAREALKIERAGYAPTLVVSRDRESATQLADRRQQASLAVAVATSSWAAHAAMRVRFYGLLVSLAVGRLLATVAT